MLLHQSAPLSRAGGRVGHPLVPRGYKGLEECCAGGGGGGAVVAACAEDGIHDREQPPRLPHLERQRRCRRVVLALQPCNTPSGCHIRHHVIISQFGHEHEAQVWPGGHEHEAQVWLGGHEHEAQMWLGER